MERAFDDILSTTCFNYARQQWSSSGPWPDIKFYVMEYIY